MEATQSRTVAMDTVAPSFKSTDPPNMLVPAYLPLELVEAILIHLPLRFPLSELHDAERTHEQCVAALTVVHPRPMLAKVVVPRLLNGAELIISIQKRFGEGMLKDLHRRGFRFPLAPAFAVAVQNNRVDLLEWWVGVAKLALPNMSQEDTWQDYSSQVALDNDAWDALDWLARSGERDSCDLAFTAEQLADLIRTGVDRKVRFVELWISAGYELKVEGYLITETKVIDAACEMGYANLLDAWARGHEDFDWGCEKDVDTWCHLAIANGRGQGCSVLEWMLDDGWAMPNVAEYASECGNLRVLEWFKINYYQIEAQLWVRFDKPEPFSYAMHMIESERRLQRARAEWPDLDDVDLYINGCLEPEDGYNHDMEIEPEWLSERKYGFCLDLAKSNGHQDVIEWWKKNADILPIPYSCEKVAEASSKCDLEFLKTWSARWNALARETPYDCYDELWQAAVMGDVHVLEWWLNDSGIKKLKKSHIQRIIRGQLGLDTDKWEEMIYWWVKKSGVEVDLDEISRLLLCKDKVHRWNIFRAKYG